MRAWARIPLMHPLSPPAVVQRGRSSRPNPTSIQAVVGSTSSVASKPEAIFLLTELSGQDDWYSYPLKIQ